MWKVINLSKKQSKGKDDLALHELPLNFIMLEHLLNAT